jgi:adenylate cyclase, class 2
MPTLNQSTSLMGCKPMGRMFARSRNGAAVVTLDETPIGDFLELEGPGEWIDDTAKRLGFSRQDYVLDSYARLYVADCERRGVEPSHMVFASHS